MRALRWLLFALAVAAVWVGATLWLGNRGEAFFGRLEIGLSPDKVDPSAAIRGLATPIFFIHGEADAIVPPDCARILHDAYGGPKKLRLEPGAGHGGTAFANLVRYRRELRDFYMSAVAAPAK